MKRYNVDNIKQTINDWLDDNIEHEYMKYPELYLWDNVNEKRYYMRLVERIFFDENHDQEEYYCFLIALETKRVEMTDVKFQWFSEKERENWIWNSKIKIRSSDCLF